MLMSSNIECMHRLSSDYPVRSVSPVRICQVSALTLNTFKSVFTELKAWSAYVNHRDLFSWLCFSGWGVPWDWLGGGQHWDKLGAVGNLLLDFRTGNDVGPHLHQSHLTTDTQPRTSQPHRVLIWLLSNTSGVDRWGGGAAPIS